MGKLIERIAVFMFLLVALSVTSAGLVHVFSAAGPFVLLVGVIVVVVRLVWFYTQ
jgi:hypothetical protein